MQSRLPLLHVLREVRQRLVQDLSLQRLSRRAGWSPFHFHRIFCDLVGETPKQYTLRLRLDRAASRLLTTDAPVLQIALDSGFRSPEVFTRAFVRHFKRTPSQYRSGTARIPAAARESHTELIASVSPCVRLFHFNEFADKGPRMPDMSVTRETRAPQPFLFVRRRVARSEIAATLADGFGKVFAYCQQRGLPLSGRPTARYLVTGPGLLTIDAGVPLSAAAEGLDDIQAGELQGGPVAVGVHAGSYAELPAANAAIERWIEEHGYQVAGAPWESYLTDPAEFPDPADWRTEICWPLAT